MKKKVGVPDKSALYNVDPDFSMGKRSEGCKEVEV
jgi:hypothetical protein